MVEYNKRSELVLEWRLNGVHFINTYGCERGNDERQGMQQREKKSRLQRILFSLGSYSIY